MARPAALISKNKACYITSVFYNHFKRKERLSARCSRRRLLQKAAEEDDNKPAKKEVLLLRAALLGDRLGWQHLERAERTRLLAAFPAAYAPF